MIVSDIFFDLDHTLWDFEKNSALAFETIFNKHKMEVPLQEFLKYYVPINLKYWEWFRNETINQSQLRYGRLKETFDLLDFEIEEEKILFLSQEYIVYLPQFNYLFDGAIAILDYLKPKYNLHIITNGFQEIQQNKLKNANIGHYFQTVTNSEIAGVKKPNPKIFEYALRQANAVKIDSVMIGDCLEADVIGALDFGMDAIFFNTNGVAIQQHVKQVSNLLQLKEYL